MPLGTKQGLSILLSCNEMGKYKDTEDAPIHLAQNQRLGIKGGSVDPTLT